MSAVIHRSGNGTVLFTLVVFAEILPHFSPGEQYDAHEFLMHVIDASERESA